MPVIGFLHPLSADAVADNVNAFLHGLSEAGRVEGRNVAIEYRWAEGQYDRLSGFARDLVARPVTAILAGATASAMAAKSATATIPIVFTGVGADPVELGLVASLNRPGGNVTGVSVLTISLTAKRLELLRELVPAADVIGILVNPSYPTAQTTLRDTQAAATMLERRLVVASAATETDFDTAFARLRDQGAGAVLVASDPFFLAQRDRLSVLAAQYKLPAIYEFRAFVAAGGLMSYAPSIGESYRQAAAYLARVLNGAKPADLPVMQPTKFELAINLKSAKALGLEVPQTLLARADEVIE
jgi:putative ABC transport system substrate-binding protein